MQTILKIRSTAVAAMLVLCVSLTARADNSQLDDSQLEEGAELYEQFCSTCHGDDRIGLLGYKADLEVFSERLAGETEDMPDFTDFFEAEEITAMHAYLTQPEE